MKTKEIDPNEYFAESKKAIQIVLEKEKLIHKQMKAHEKLALVRKYKNNTGDPGAYDALEKLERELDRKVRFDLLNEPAIPEEHREKVLRNVAVEQLEYAETLNGLKDQLRFHYKYLEDEVLPLLENIAKLERLNYIPNQVDVLLKNEIGEDTIFKVENLIRPFESGSKLGKHTINSVKQAILNMQKLEFPFEMKEVKGGKN